METNFIQELKTEAQKKGRKLSSVARELNISRSVISRWEREAPKTIKTYIKLKKAVSEL